MTGHTHYAGMTLDDQLREHAYWKGRRDELIRRALAAGYPVERIAAMMDIAQSVIRRVRDVKS